MDPGTVAERRWENLNWQRPADETSPCWWLANAAAAKAADEEDQEAPVKLVCRSLQVLRLELRATRCATSLKLRQEWERRLENNGRSVDVLESNGQLWKHVGGPSPHLLRRPTEADVVVAHSAVNNLKRLLQKREEAGPADDGLAAFAEEICTAVRKIKVVSWEAIHRERFPLTPLGIYGELCRNAQVLIERQAADAYRRLARLAAADIAQAEEPTQEEFEAPHPDLKPLYYRETNGPDLEAFKMKCNYRPQAMPRAVAQASEVS